MAPADDRSDLRPVVTASATLGAVVGVFGVAFGVGAVSAGGSVAQACAMSLLVFTGASQFSAVSVIAAGGTTAAAMGGAMVLAARNGVYGLAMSRVIGGSLAARLVAAQLTIDESTAMAAAQTEVRAQRTAFWITGASIYVFWNIGTLLGALAGSAIDPETYGLDAAFPAGFVAMVTPQLRTRSGFVAGALGALICLVLIPIAPIGIPVLCASAAVLIGIPARPSDVADLPGNRGCPMTWTLVLLLGAGAYACKFIGLVVIGSRPLPAAVERCLALVPAALISALIVQATFSTGQELVLDARAVGVGVAAVAAWRRAPLVVVIILGAAVTAVVRRVS